MVAVFVGPEKRSTAVFVVVYCSSSSSSSNTSSIPPFRLSTLIVQTLAVMFRETEVEPARLNLLSAKK